MLAGTPAVMLPHDEFLELHVRNISGGEFTHHVFSGMKERDILRIKGPLGTLFLREDSDKLMLGCAQTGRSVHAGISQGVGVTRD